jgi:cytidine deaminase
MTDDALIAAARQAALKAYAPYSHFHVGCVIVSTDGRQVTGANLENACYRLGICAEQSALSAAQHLFGLGNIARIVVSGGAAKDGKLTGDSVVTPCGGCRQAILEAAQVAGSDLEILCASGNGQRTETHRIGALIPHGFGPANLAEAD